MTPTFRPAARADIPAVLALLRDDALGATRETDDLTRYEAAFADMQKEGANTLFVGEIGDDVVATYQLTFITGLSLRATRRAQIESVRVASDRRGTGVGAALVADAEARARAAGCGLLQLTMHASRDRARAFYERNGFAPTHTGFKKPLP